MAPALNSKASSDPSAVEKLLVRLIPRPSERCLSVGDIVAHQSPLIHAAQAEQQQVCAHAAAVVDIQPAFCILQRAGSLHTGELEAHNPAEYSHLTASAGNLRGLGPAPGNMHPMPWPCHVAAGH